MTGFSSLNYVNLGPHGTFKPSGDLSTTPEDIDAIFAHLTTSGADKLCLHFHGGLVNEAKGLSIAQSMYPIYTDAGAHAVSFIWETGLFETLRRNLTTIHKTKLFQKLLRYAIRQLSKRLGADLTGRGEGQAMSSAEVEILLGDLSKFETLNATARSGAAHLEERALDEIRNQMEFDLQLEMDNDEELGELVDDLFAEDPHLRAPIAKELSDSTDRSVSLVAIAKFLAKVLYRVLRRYLKGRDHGLYPTVIEELLREFYLDDFGGWIWGRMKDVSRQVFLPNTGVLTETSHPGTYFLKKLAAHQANTPGFTVDLVGHSAGSIVVCNLFRAVETFGLDVKICNVMFLAPACTSQLMYNEIVTRPDRYARFRMFTMNDSKEQTDAMLPGIYTRSLLYLISGVLEDEADTPVAGMERFWTGRAPFDAAYLVESANWLTEAGKDRAVLSVTKGNAPGLNSASEKHGDFDNDEETRRSLTHVVSQS